MTHKPHFSPAQIAARVTESMRQSAPEVDLNALTDMKHLENTMIETLREVRLSAPHLINNPISKH
ncbi:MAG: hypothetical protein KDI90_12495 [Alphaproteobacteria bacterium]|nr:hypothetical protein [Alphaproteobacteria bacterium]